MRDVTDTVTIDLLGEKRGRGRPRKADALSNAQRQAAYRARHRLRAKSVTVTENDSADLIEIIDGKEAVIVSLRKLCRETCAERDAALRRVDQLELQLAEMKSVTHNSISVSEANAHLELGRLTQQLVEVEQREQLAWREMRDQRDKREELSRELADLRRELVAAKSVTRNKK